jgi:small-conductance mechanosensitive channel
MENLLAVTIASLLIGIPVIVAEHYAVQSLWPENHVLVRYILGSLAIAAVLVTAWLLTRRPELIAELVVVLAITGGTTMGCYWLDHWLALRRGQQAADQAEREARRGPPPD